MAPFTAGMLYVFKLPAQTVAFPLMVPGMAGAEFTVTLNICAADDPQAFCAITVISPFAGLAVVEIEVVVEEPTQPEGKVHV